MKYLMPERWKDVPGYEGRYQASTWGEIRRRAAKGWRRVKPHTRPSSRDRHVQKVFIREANGQRREFSVLGLIAATWCPPPEGYVAIHRNGVFSENGVENILFIRHSKLIEHFANRSKRRAVIRVDGSGNPVECYANAKEAARAAHVSHSTMCNHLNGKVQKPYSTDGIHYKWDD